MKKFITLFLLALITSASVAQWSEQTSGVTTTLYSVSAIDNNTTWICGAGGKVLVTTNGGTNWIITASPNSSLDLYNIWGIDSNRALVTGSGSTTYVYKTTNRGANWTQVFLQTGGFIDAIVGLLSYNNQFAMIGDPVGGRWSLWHSDNNGTTWDSAGLYIPQAGTEAGYNNSAFDIGPNGGDYYWFGTNNTRVYRGIFGSNWTPKPTTGQQNSLAILFLDTLNGLIGGSTGLLITSNGGANWVGLAGVPGSGSINGLAAGSTGEFFYSRGTSIYRSTNSGLNWAVSNTQTGSYTHMQRARTANNYNIWAIRNNGGISKYAYPIGIKSISSELPGSFTLYQNYPNPFNPSTKIRFSVPPESRFGGNDNIVLKIYDALGRDIAILVNQKLQAGSYEVDWNASDYPSGVYFYKLSAGDFSQNRRMILLK